MFSHHRRADILEEETDTAIATNGSIDSSSTRDRQEELRAELARKVGLFVGSAESRVTDIPGLTLYRHTAPTAPASATFEPSVAVVVQGQKHVELGQNVFVYDGSRFLLTSLDLPVISRVVEASQDVPYLCLRLKLEMPIIREFLGREELELSRRHRMLLG